MECLYADPERKVTQTNIPCFQDIFHVEMVIEVLSGLFLNMQAYDVLGLYYGLGRTFFNPASV